MRQILRDHAASLLRDERVPLFLRHLHLGANFEEGLGLYTQARKEISLIAVILVRPTEPIPHRNLLDPWHLLDSCFVRNQDGLRQRDSVPDDEPQRTAGRLLAKEERVIHGDQHAQQTQRDSNTRNREKTPAAIAQRILERK